MTEQEMHKETLRKLDEYFKNTPKEVVDRHIAEISAMKFPGPTAEEYFLNFNQYYFGIEVEEESDESEEKDRA